MAPDAPVCHDGERLQYWREIAARIAASAAELRQQPGLRCLVSSDTPQDFAIALFAAFHAGKEVVVPPSSQPGAIAQLAGAFDCIALPSPGRGAVVCDAAETLPPLDAAQTWVNLYTSGSTGAPKQIRKSLQQIDAEVAVLDEMWGPRLAGAPVVASAPHLHFYGMQFRLLWPLSAGRVFDGVTCSTPEMVLERLQCFSEAFFVSSPAMLSRLPELMPLASLLPRPRMILSSGGPLPRSAAQAFHTQLGQAPSEIFGSTESGAIAWRRQESDDAWTPLPGVSVAVDDDTALMLTSPFMADASAWRMDDGVAQLPDGRFRLLGRLDRTVKIEEKRLSLPDLEGRLAAHPWVGAAAAVVLPGRRQRLGVALVASAAGREVMRVEGRRAATEELRSHLADYFDPVLVPRHWRFVDSLPVNERGKLTQGAVVALFRAVDDVAVAA